MSARIRPQDRSRIPATIVTGFLGTGKTSLVRHVLAHAGGRRIAIIVNEFGSLGIDGAALRECGIPGCDEGSIVELANGCLCCTVADEFLPAMTALIERPEPPDHILIETSGLALPKPLIKAFDWPAIRAAVTVDGVVTLVDGPAYRDGLFADDPEAVAAARASDPTLEHDAPLAELFDDQLAAADLVILNKTDLLDADETRTLAARLDGATRPGVRIVPALEGRVDTALLLGLGAAAEDDLAARPSSHDAEDGAHEHDDFSSFVAAIPEQPGPEPLLARLAAAIRDHDILRIKGVVAIAGKPRLLRIEAAGPRIRREYGRDWRDGEPRSGRLVVIGLAGMDEAAILRDLDATRPQTPGAHTDQAASDAPAAS